MERRIFGLENEYGVTCTFRGQRRLSPDEVARYLFRRVVHWGRSSNVFLENGARLYLDVGSHPEYATPECDDVRELVGHDKAGERILEALLGAAEMRLHEEGISGQVYLFKNNTDSAGNSYGCHENYLVARHGEFARMADVLIPFFVTRQIYCGAGKVLHGPRGAQFCISQRAEHIWEGVSSATTRSRPIINTRDEPHADAERFRRLHVIVGDSNMSEWTTFMKVGITDLVLRMRCNRAGPSSRRTSPEGRSKLAASPSRAERYPSHASRPLRAPRARSARTSPARRAHASSRFEVSGGPCSVANSPSRSEPRLRTRGGARGSQRTRRVGLRIGRRGLEHLAEARQMRRHRAQTATLREAPLDGALLGEHPSRARPDKQSTGKRSQDLVARSVRQSPRMCRGARRSSRGPVCFHAMRLSRSRMTTVGTAGSRRRAGGVRAAGIGERHRELDAERLAIGLDEDDLLPWMQGDERVVDAIAVVLRHVNEEADLRLARRCRRSSTKTMTRGLPRIPRTRPAAHRGESNA